MRTTLQIDDDVLASAREIASADGRSVGAVISALARRALEPPTIRIDHGFPTFDVAAAAPTITAGDVARALDEE